MFHHTACACTLIALGTISLVGCGAGSSPAPQATAEHDDHDHEDGHHSGGPHGGSVIDLGNGEFHAELVHDDDTGQISVYVLDTNAKEAAPVDAAEVKMNLRHDDEAQQFSIAASPDEGDPQGKSSRFVSTEKELARGLDHDHAHGQIVLTIDDKQYRGDIGHDHDDESHDHDDDSHDHDTSK